MSRPAKKVKLSIANDLSDQLNSTRMLIKNIQSGKLLNSSPSMDILNDQQFAYADEDVESLDEISELSSLSRKEFKAAEVRIHRRIDDVENKLDTIMKMLEQIQQQQSSYEALEVETLSNAPCASSQDEDQQLIEIVDMEKSEELDFPIADEDTFEWMQSMLADETFRANLVEKRSQIVRGLSFKTLMVAVKQFLLHHFELECVTKYSCSGYGAHGTRKKKANSKLIAQWIYECFLREDIDTTLTIVDIMKCVVQFFGRAPDMYNKRLTSEKKKAGDRSHFEEALTD